MTDTFDTFPDEWSEGEGAEESCIADDDSGSDSTSEILPTSDVSGLSDDDETESESESEDVEEEDRPDFEATTKLADKVATQLRHVNDVLTRLEEIDATRKAEEERRPVLHIETSFAQKRARRFSTEKRDDDRTNFVRP